MKKYIDTGKKDTRSGFGAGLAHLGRTNKNVVALCADLIGSLKMDEFIAENPERFYQIGIAEANMIGIAAGLTIGGKFHLLGHLPTFQLVGFTIKSDNLLLTQIRMLKYVPHMLA
jgi:transketolase